MTQFSSQFDRIIDRFSQTMTLSIITTSLSDFAVSESVQTQTIRGVLKPFKNQDLQILPTEQRGWRWLSLITKSPIQFKLDDQVRINQITYRIMGARNYGFYGYKRVDMIEDYR